MVSSESDQVPHWNIDVKEGKWTQSDSKYFKKCDGKSAWFGWTKYQAVGQVKAKLYGIGSGKLTFGNCGEAGDVAVYLNNVLLDSASKHETKSVEFEFQHESELKLTDEGGGSFSPKIQIFEFQIISSKIIQFTYHFKSVLKTKFVSEMVNPFDYSSIIPRLIHKQDFWVNTYFDTADGTIEFCNSVDENCNDLVKFKDDSIWKFLPDMKINFGTGPDRQNIRMRGDFSFQDAQSNDLSIHKRLICEFECCKDSYTFEVEFSNF